MGRCSISRRKGLDGMPGGEIVCCVQEWELIAVRCVDGCSCSVGNEERANDVRR